MPISASAFDGEEVFHVSCGAYHTVAITGKSGSIYSWGLQTKGCILHADIAEGREQALPRRVACTPNARFLKVECGFTYTAAIACPAQGMHITTVRE